MSKAYFSPSNLAFYPADWKADGSYSETMWPPDAVLLTDDEAAEYWKRSPPAGKLLGVADGRPAWVDVPPPTTEQLIAQAEQQKSTRKATADAEIDWRQDAVDAGIATAEETAALAEWKKYRVLLMRVDTLKAPDIEWPTPPV